MVSEPHHEGAAGRVDEHAERFYEHTRHVREEAGELASAVSATVAEAEAYLRDQLERRPYQTLGVAAGIGFVLGGGLASPLTRMVIGMAGRAALARILQSSLEPRGAAAPPEEGPAASPFE